MPPVDIEHRRLLDYAGDLTQLPINLSTTRVSATWRSVLAHQWRYSGGDIMLQQSASHMDYSTLC